MEHFKDNSGCSGPKKNSEIFWNNSRNVQYVFAGKQNTTTQKQADAIFL